MIVFKGHLVIIKANTSLFQKLKEMFLLILYDLMQKFRNPGLLQIILVYVNLSMFWKLNLGT